MSEDETTQRTFNIAGGAAGDATLHLLGGAALLCVMPLTLWAAIYRRLGFMSMQMIAVPAGLVGVSLIMRALSIRRSPVSVTIGEPGVTIVRRSGASTFFAWDRIGWLTVSPMLNSNARQAVAFSPAGKSLFKISSDVEEFGTLINLVNAFLARKDTATANQLHSRKARKAALFIGAFAVILLVMCTLNLCLAREQQRTESLFRDSAVVGEARIVEHLTAPDGVTKRVVCSITGNNGKTGEINVEVRPELWETLAVGQSIAVKFVPDEPDVAHLVAGELQDDFGPGPSVMIPLSFVLLAFDAFLFVIAVLNFRGLELCWDTHKGRPSTRRFGTGGKGLI